MCRSLCPVRTGSRPERYQNERRAAPKRISRVGCPSFFQPSTSPQRQEILKSGRSVMPGVFQDLRHGLRALASHPGLAIATALTLGLAIGALTSVYCLIDALFLRPPAGVTRGASPCRDQRAQPRRPRRRRDSLSRLSLLPRPQHDVHRAGQPLQFRSRSRGYGAGGGTGCARRVGELFLRARCQASRRPVLSR